MAYSSTNPPVLIISEGIADSGGKVYQYSSTHTSTEILGAGFFAGCGAGSRGGSDLGMKKGDILLNRASTDATVPGRVTWHSVVSSTADQSSTTASTGWKTSYNVSVASAT